MSAPYRMLGLRGIRVCCAVVSGLNEAGSLLRPFMKVQTRQAVRSALPNGHTPVFYNARSKYGLRPAFRTHHRGDLNRVFGLLADATLIPNVAACYPLSEAGTAVTLAESRTTRGEAILVPWADQRDLPPFF